MQIRRYPQPIEMIITYLFPEFCIGCGARDEMLCSNCIKDIPPITAPIKDIWARYSYQNPLMREAVSALKYKHHIGMAAAISPLFTEHIVSVLDTFSYLKRSDIYICPIPLHPARERERGFNQVHLLTIDFMERSPDHGFVYVKDLLSKINKTDRQVTSSKRERLSNVAHSMELSPGKDVYGKTIFILDDVTTTGATIKEARRALLAAGARAAYGIALAH